MTNADKIRSMTDEELAVMIMCPHDGDIEECTLVSDEDSTIASTTCIDCCTRWLKEEVE